MRTTHTPSTRHKNAPEPANSVQLIAALLCAALRCAVLCCAVGWDAPAVAKWLELSAEKASQAAYGKSACYLGEGGSIPFMGMLGKMFPEAQVLPLATLRNPVPPTPVPCVAAAASFLVGTARRHDWTVPERR